MLHALSLLASVPPPLDAARLASTDITPLPTVVLLVAAGLYLWGVARARRLHPRHPWAWWRTGSFLAALVVVALALESFIGRYDVVLFWDHMVQHLMLIMVAAPLLAVGSPVALAFRATAGRSHARLAAGLRSRPAQVLGNPLVAFVLYAVAIPVTHLTVFYNYTLLHPGVEDLEHGVFLVCGYLFWRQVFGLEPNRHRLHPALQLAYLFLAVPVDTFTGVSLNSTTHELFPAAAALHQPWAPSLITDLHYGGVIMWVCGDSLMTLAMIPVAIHWLRTEERRAVRVDRELDRIMPYPERRAAAPSAPAPRGRAAVFKPTPSGFGRPAPLPQGPRPGD